MGLAGPGHCRVSGGWAIFNGNLAENSLPLPEPASENQPWPLDDLEKYVSAFSHVRGRFGLAAAILAVLVLGIILVWWKWKEVSERP